VALGHSAGRHLALWAAARHRLPKTSPLWRADPLPIRAVISLGGIGDLEGRGRLRRRLRAGADPEDHRPGDAATPTPTPRRPSCCRRRAGGDDLRRVRPRDAAATGRDYVARLTRAGDAGEAIAIPDVGHFDVVIPTTAAWKQVAGVVAREVARLR
jgi:acetyl esterase/lipase